MDAVVSPDHVKVSSSNARRWIPRPWKNRPQMFQYLQDLDREKRLAYDMMDKEGYGHWTVWTAAIGFLTGSYDIFAVNMVLPIINIVYWDGQIPPNVELAINMATLVGTMIGQVFVGIMGDRFGRKKMFGTLLLIMIAGTVPIALLSRGTANNINFLSWMISWRILTGIGIGGDYPLSAVITAEFAPKRHRGRMIATVFYAQPIGQLIACIVAIAVTAGYRRSIPGLGNNSTNCDAECIRGLDSTWRWIVGCGAIPPAFAVLLRFWIPESPRWLFEVDRNPMGKYAARYHRTKFEEKDPLADEEGDVEVEDDSNTEMAEFQHFSFGRPAIDGKISPVEAHRKSNDSSSEPSGLHADTTGYGKHASVMSAAVSRSTVVNHMTEDDDIEVVEPVVQEITTPNKVLLSARASPYTIPKSPELLPNSPDDKQLSISFQPLDAPFNDQALQEDHFHPNGSNAPRHQGKESWSEFWHGFGVYLFGTEKWTLHRFWLSIRSKDEHDGSWTDLAGTASTWFGLDFSFYFLTVNSTKLISKIWDSPDTIDLYSMLQNYSTRAMISTSIGALLGGALFILMARQRWHIQLFGFLALAALFVVVGVCYITLLDGRYFAALIVLYIACNLVFDFGPNTATFVIPAEVFPTKYRATCHGLSAGAGKLGSILTQIFLAKVTFGGKGVNDPDSNWLGWVLIIQAAVMLLGAGLTKAWVPNPCDINGNSRSLEDLGKGKVARLCMEREERERQATSLEMQAA